MTKNAPVELTFAIYKITPELLVFTRRPQKLFLVWPHNILKNDI